MKTVIIMGIDPENEGLLNRILEGILLDTYWILPGISDRKYKIRR